MWWLCAADGPIPVGDVVYVAGIGVMSIADAISTFGADTVVHMIADAPNAIAEGIKVVGDKVQEGWAWLQDTFNKAANWFSETFGGGGSSQPPRDPGDWEKLKETAHNFRENLRRMTGKTDAEIKGLQAHHVFPQKYNDLFDAAGINIHEAQYGSWVDSIHQSWSYSYNQDWLEFFDFFKQSGSVPTQQQILDFGRMLAGAYGFTIYF